MADPTPRDKSGNYPNEYARWGVDPPHSIEHGEFDESKLVPFKATEWWIDGNMLHANGNHGHMAHTIPTDHICKGIDDKGMPILVKLSDHRAEIEARRQEREKALHKSDKPAIK